MPEENENVEPETNPVDPAPVPEPAPEPAPEPVVDPAPAPEPVEPAPEPVPAPVAPVEPEPVPEPVVVPEPEPVVPDVPEPVEPIPSPTVDVADDELTRADVPQNVQQRMAELLRKRRHDVSTVGEAQELLKDDKLFWETYNLRTWH